MENETKVCKHCKTEIPKKAKVCPNCRKKQGGILKWIVIVIIAIAIIGAIAGGGDDKSSTSSNNKKDENIEYVACTVSEMMETLDENALKAETTYQDKYVEVTGRLATIDSDGKYISLLPTDNDWAIIGVHCDIETDEQKAQVAEMTVGDTVTVQGKITDIGEILGYTLEIHSIK